MSRLVERLSRTVRWDGGIRIADTALWLDVRQRRELGFISHAHADHAVKGGHGRTLATPATLALLGLGGKEGAMPCRYQRPFSLGELRLELLPSGHIAGGAQLLVEHRGLRILYTGDIYDERQRFARPLVITTCDLLVIEATYGTPRHRFPPRDEAAELLREEVAEALESDRTPLVLVEGSLGRAQEIIAELTAADHAIVVSKSIARWNRRARKAGIEVPRCRPYGGRPERGTVLLYPMRSRGLKGLNAIKGLVKIACSGQIGDQSVARRLGVDRVVPFVDHADFDGLIRVAEACRPKVILTVYGYAEQLAAALRERGHHAEALSEGPQMFLDL